jgi:hypothetical protein
MAKILPVADAILDSNNDSLDSLLNYIQSIGSELTDDRFLFSVSNFYEKYKKAIWDNFGQIVCFL